MTDPRKLAAAVRPQILKLARQGKMIDEAFKVTRKGLYPDATPEQIAMMRTMFFAGAGELMALQMYGVSEGDEITAQDDLLYAAIGEEIEQRHSQAIQLAFTKFGGKAQ